MSVITFIYTDLPLNKLEYNIEDMFDEEYPLVISLDGSPVWGISFSKEKLHEIHEEATGHLFPELIRYHVIKSAGVYFEYNKHFPEGMKRSAQMCLDWLFSLVRDHLRSGAKKFYYSELWISFNPDKKKPKMEKIDLANFKPDDTEFSFGNFTIWEFVDSSIK